MRWALAQTLASAGEAFVFHEGVTHEIWRSLYLSPEHRKADWWRPYLCYAGPRVVIVDVDLKVAKHRIQKKQRLGPINRELRDAPIDGPLWENASAAYEMVIEALMSTPGVETIRLPLSEATIAEACSEVLKAIQRPDRDEG